MEATGCGSVEVLLLVIRLTFTSTFADLRDSLEARRLMLQR